MKTLLASLAGFLQKLHAPAMHLRVNQAVERLQGTRVRQHLGSERPAIQRAVRPDNLGAEALGNPDQRRLPRCLDLPDYLISVDDGCAPAAKEFRHGGFARTDVARERDGEHVGYNNAV